MISAATKVTCRLVNSDSRGRIHWYISQEDAWDVAERVFGFVERRFDRIEKYVRKALVPFSGIHRKCQLTREEAGRQIIEAMRHTESVEFLIHDVGYSKIYYEGPQCLRYCTVSVLFDEQGRLLTVRL